jgi:hypothetical protein
MQDTGLTVTWRGRDIETLTREELVVALRGATFNLESERGWSRSLNETWSAIAKATGAHSAALGSRTSLLDREPRDLHSLPTAQAAYAKEFRDQDDKLAARIRLIEMGS